MATMHYLLFGILSVVILLLGGFGNCPVAVNLRQRIVDIAVREIGVQEATGHNDGPRVAEYLAYTGLGKGHAWCAAFVSWCYSQAGLTAPRNAWSPALFPMARRYTEREVKLGAIRQADLFAIYNNRLRRIDHAGIIRERRGSWLLTVEGNSENRVLSKRRPIVTIYAFSNWLD